MEDIRASYANKQSSKELILSVCAFEGGVEWFDGACSVENSLITSRLSKFATDLNLYISRLNLLDTYRVVDKFEKDGSAWVEVYIENTNHELTGFENNIATIRTAIKRCIDQHVEIIHEISSSAKKFDKNFRGGNAAVEAFAKFLTNKLDTELRFEFPNQETKILNAIRKLETKVHPKDCVETATGEVMSFNESDQKVTLFNVQPSQGQLILSVLKPIQREKILDSQKDKRQISVNYNPTLDLMRPDKKSRCGVLVEIIWIGPTQTAIPE